MKVLGSRERKEMIEEGKRRTIKGFKFTQIKSSKRIEKS